MQLLQVTSLRSGQPIVFHPGQADADILSPDVKDLHTYGLVFKTKWITIHDTETDGRAPFNANALANSATIDSGFSGMPGFQNEGDNEITGIHVSDGDPSDDGLLGNKIPRPFHDGWRVFYTQQHGDNFTWEILPARPGREDRDDD